MAHSFLSFPLNSGLGRKFLLWLLVISLVPLTLVSVISYHYAGESLLQDTEQALTAATQLKERYIEAFFDERIANLALQVALAENIRFVSELHRTASVAVGQGVNKAVPAASEQMHGDLARFINQYGYHDVLIVDLDGTILFAVSENEENIGENLFRGHLGKTALAASCRRALESGRTEFADIESRGDGHELDCFLVRVVLGADGQPVGLMAVQMSLEQVDRLMQDSAGMGESGETFLVGADYLMRSDSKWEPVKTAMRIKVDTGPVRDWVATEKIAARGSA